MLVFFVVILLLYLLSFKSCSLSILNKEKTNPIKGIMAILIVAHHLALQTGRMDFFASWGAPLVSVFFFLSGYGLMISFKLRGDIYIQSFLRKRIFFSLLVPFVIALCIYRGINHGSVSTLIDAIRRLIIYGETSLPHSWYVFVIFFFYLVFYISSRIFPKHITTIIAATAIFYTAIAMSLDYPRCWYITALAFPTGLIYATYEKRFLLFCHTTLRYYAIVPICLAAILILFVTKNIYAYMLIYIILPIMIGCLLAKIPVERLNKPSIFISKMSYEIYLSQGIAMSILRGKYLYINSDIQYIIYTFILTLLIAYGIQKISIFSQSIVSKIQ